MAGNSLKSLLEKMQQGSTTQGWGAISIVSRSRLNRLLEQQFIRRFNGHSFLPPFSGSVSEGAGSFETVELRDIGLGQPLLSFNSASLANSTALLTMNIIAGRYTASRQGPDGQTTVLSVFKITEQQGFKLEMEIDLSVVVGEIDKRGKIKMNLAQGLNFSCNLAGNDGATNTRLASLFKEKFEELPESRSVFHLGDLGLKGYNNLTPRSFRVRTQAAPGAKIQGALNYGDGAVVAFIRLQGNSSEGQLPPGPDFPYFIPDDKALDGSDKFSAALIVSEAMIPYIQDGQLGELDLQFPDDNLFEEVSRHTPRDIAVFGNISPKQTRIAVEPSFKTLKAGDTQQFKLYDWKGQPITASKWSAVSLQSHTQGGHGTITANGLYTAASKALMGHDSLHIVVTAEYIREKVTYRASSLVLVAFDQMTVAPRVATFAAQTQVQPIALQAWTAQEESVTWSLLAPEYGTLSKDGNRSRFTPDARARVKSLVVQRLEASGNEKHQSSLVLINAQQQLNIDPPYVPALKNANDVQLKDDASLLPGVPRRWKVISGGGTVDARGRFTAPAQGIASSSVVQCEIVRNGVVLSSGYSVVEFSEMEPEPTWKDLSQFTVKVPGGSGGNSQGSLYGNGYQQAIVEILVETVPVDDIAYPLSVIEKASMRLVDDRSKAHIEFVDDALDGIPEDDDQVWRTRLIPNRFDLAFPRMAALDNAPDPDPAISLQDIYVHSRGRAGTPITLHATFQADSDQYWHKSTDITDVNGKIVLTPLELPVFQGDEYSFVRRRVNGGGPSIPSDPDDHDFDYYLRTVDYWTLKYTGKIGGVAGTTFETLEFLPVDGKTINTSTIRWESEQMWENMFSWTGYIFQDPQKPADISKIKFDQDEKDVVLHETLDVDVNPTFFEHGTLVISLHRSDRVPYVRPDDKSRAKLSRDLAVVLIDKRGNSHKQRISFLAPSVEGDRNKLVRALFTPLP